MQVIDASNPRKPKLTANLTSPAMLTGTWETLKVNQARGLLAGVSVGPVIGALAFDVYDIKADCTKPKLLNSFAAPEATLPATTINHEGEWAPDGNRLYLTTAFPAGVIILDVSEIQARKPVPMIRQLGSVTWGGPASVGQHTIPVTWDGKPHLVAVDEFSGEAIRIIDISDETKPTVVRQLQLEIQRPENAEVGNRDVAGNGLFGYEAHYCTVDRPTDPTALACGFFQSGIRVFDIRDPLKPRELAYFNPPAQVGRNGELSGSEHATANFISFGSNGSDIRDAGPGVLLGSTGAPANLSADWCSSPPRFVGKNQLWVSCQDNGFLALRFTNDAYAKP